MGDNAPLVSAITTQQSPCTLYTHHFIPTPTLPRPAPCSLFLFKCLRQLQLNACCEGSLALTDLSNEVRM